MTDVINSTDDRRVENSTVRHNYRILSQDEKDQMQSVKDLGQEILDWFDILGKSRELSIAATNVEQAVMWAVKHITK